jgi:hypothetical protein
MGEENLVIHYLSSCRNTSQFIVTRLLMESLRLLACFRPDTAQPSCVNPLSAPKHSSRSEDKREGKLMSTTDDVYYALLLSAPLLQPTPGVCSVVSPQSRARSTSILLLRNPTAHLPSSLSSTSTFPRRREGETLCRLLKPASERIPRHRGLHKHYIAHPHEIFKFIESLILIDNYACLSCQILPVVMARTAESRGAAELVGWKEHPVRCL